MLRQPLLLLARSDSARKLTETLPPTQALVDRFVAGETVPDAVATARELSAAGLLVTIDYLGEDVEDVETAEQNVAVYEQLLAALGEAGLAATCEVSLKLSAIGQALTGSGEGTKQGDDLALENARRVCRAARNAGTTVTIDMEDHTTTDRTLQAVRDLRQDFPETGAVVQSQLKRTEKDLQRLVSSTSRVRLCKGAYAEPEGGIGHATGIDNDLAYVRCLKTLMTGDGYPMVATHDPRLIEIAQRLAHREGRSRESYEIQMLLGVRPEEQKRLAAQGEQVRVYVPFGEAWYGYLVRRLAERPANLALFLRALVSRD
ncbi:proline dehydrogenase family protein [Nocardioidaceae bacterium]|nr:proline dehydrogenase family protein [Nocardioidaceae bacterium]